MIPVNTPLLFTSKYSQILEIPINMQIPTIIFISLLFERQVVYNAFTIYLFIGVFILPILNQGGSLGYLLTPNFGYLIGTYFLIKIIDNFKKENKLSILNFLFKGILAISSMHIVGILYNFLQMLYYNQIDLFLYNLGYYSISKIGYHFLMLVPLSLLIKPLINFKYKK